MRSFKISLAVIVFAAGLSVAGQAAQLRPGRRVAPRTVVLNLYSQHRRQSPFFQTRSRVLLDRYFVNELANLIWQDALASRGEVGALNGDPLYNAQDLKIRAFAVRERATGPNAAEVVASFQNFGEKHEVVFQLEPVGASWKVANIRYDDGSSLRGILSSNTGPARDRGIPIKIYLVALNDKGKAGKKIGCDDSLVPVNRSIQRTTAPLSAALTQLLATPQHPAENPKLENFWKGRDLKVSSVAIRNGTAVINISGEVFVAGICDIPRIESQIEATAKQFPTVKRVRVFIGGQTMRNALR